MGRQFVSTAEAKPLVDKMVDNIVDSGESAHVVIVALAVMVNSFCDSAQITPEYFLTVVKQLNNRVSS